MTVAPCAVNEVESLRWESGTKNTLIWAEAQNASAYRLYRGAAAELPQLLTPAIDSCVRFEGAVTSTGPVLLESPAAISGRVYWYLVVGANGSNLGPAGNATAGPRIVNSSGACP